MDLNQLKQIQGKLKQVNQSKVEEFFKQEILENSDDIVDLVRQRWKIGKRPDGSDIGTYRSFAYEMEKRQRNPLAGGKVDLIDTGDLNRKLIVNHLTGSIFNIFSTDNKAVKIAEKYGLDVYGLSKEERKDVLIEAASRTNKRIIDFVGL